MRVFPGVGSLEADGLERSFNAGAPFSPACAAQRRERLGDDCPDALTRIEGTIGVLEDHLHMRPGRAQFASRHIEQRASLQAHGARIRPIEREGNARQRRFA